MRRLWVSALCVSAWLILLLSGFAFGGAVHLLLVAAAVLFPWRRESSEPPA
jgi:hypothetical protein